MPRKLYGSHTQKAIANFPISGWSMPAPFIRSLALIKEHAARVNGLPRIAFAAAQIKKGKHMDQFPVDVFQTGSGTSSNMNMNEVIAGLANVGSTGKGNRGNRGFRGVHPNDDVNRCQSSNDVVPTAVQIACLLELRGKLFPAVEKLIVRCEEKSDKFHEVIKIARTHLMDAVTVRLGDEFTSYAVLLMQSLESVEAAMDRLCVLPLGGTAAGTGLNAQNGFATKVIKRMREETGFPLSEAEDHIAAQSCPTTLLSLSSALKELAVSLTKIANDIRLMGSGPVSGFNELILPSLQAGSSIMPGKVNPVLCESVEQVGAWVIGADVTVTQAIASGSRFELNTCYPLLASKLLTSIELLANVTTLFGEKCVKGIKANVKVIKSQLDCNAMLVTSLAKEIGYEAAAEIVKESMRTGETILEVAQEKTSISKAKLKRLLDPEKMV